jgi:hypothetical protein
MFVLVKIWQAKLCEEKETWTYEYIYSLIVLACIYIMEYH